MKAKIVQYPFNEKKFEWDTQKQTKEFEYTWEQSQPRNFDTITPYVKTMPFDPSTKYTEEYGIWGANYPMPSIEIDSSPVYDDGLVGDCAYIYGPYKTNIPITSIRKEYPYYIGIDVELITSNNYSSTFNLSRTDFEYIWNEDYITGGEVLNLILSKNPNYEPSFGSNPNENVLHYMNILNNDEFEFCISKDVVENEQRIRIYATKKREMFDWKYSASIPNIKMIPDTIGIDVWNLDFDERNINLQKCQYTANVPRYDVGWCIYRYSQSDSRINVYYNYGKSYDISFTTDTTKIFFVDGTGTSVFIGYLRGQSGYVQKSWNSPEVDYPDTFHWASSSIQNQYENAVYGYQVDGTTNNCIAIPALNKTNGYTYGYCHFPIIISQSLNGNQYSVCPIEMIPQGTLEAYQYITKCHFGINAINTLDVYDFNKMIKVSDWPNDTEYTRIPPFSINSSATRVLLPDLKLIGDQTANTVNVPYGNTSILHYTPGDPVDRQHLNSKPVKVNAPTEYEQYNVKPVVPIPPVDAGFIVEPDMDVLAYWDNAYNDEHGNPSPDYDFYWLRSTNPTYVPWIYIPEDYIGGTHFSTDFRGCLLMGIYENDPGYNAMMLAINDMTPSPTLIHREQSGFTTKDFYVFSPNVTYRMTNYDLLFNAENIYTTEYWGSPQYDTRSYHISCKESNGFSYIPAQEGYPSEDYKFLTNSDITYTSADVVCNNGYLYLSSNNIWAAHITPSAQTPDASHLPSGYNVQNYQYMLVPDTIYTADVDYAQNYLDYIGVINDNTFPCIYYKITRTPLTFNSYTLEQWFNNYHFLGNQWNNMGSPWAYASYMNRQGDHEMMLVGCELCPVGTYVNAFTIFDQTDTVAEDTLGNTFSTSTQTYYDNIGTMYAWWDEYVTSNNRNEYPDDGYKDLFYYILQPQKTKFIAYHINEATDELTNVELFNDRYTYSHNLTDFADHTLENTVIGTPTSTNESSIPDAYYRTYKGIYYGQSIPLLNIAETVIDPGMILGVPVYNKQINTSDTLKYGTVASASLTFRVDIPVDNAMVYNNKLLVAFYDFEHNGVWEPWGFFRIDTIEAQDENCTSIVAHDEVYKLNKYVDDFLKNYTGATTLDRFFKDLLDYCDCEYDPHMATINNGNLNLNNVYNATKTTGLEVAHYIANISPGFVHANMDNDIVLAQYKPTDKVKTISDYSNLVYNAYNTDMLNKVIITMNNAVIAEDQGSGTKTYYIADNPLLSKHISEAALVLLAEKVLQKYQQIPVYRPAQIKFLTSPGLDIGDVFTVVTKNSQQYNVAVMEININEGGLEIKSMGTATYPVDPSSNSQFVNLVDSIDTVQVDVDDLNDAVAGLDGRVGDIETDITSLDGRIDATEADINGLKGRMTTAEGNITSINGDISSLDSRVDDVEDGLVTVANSLATKILADSISSANDLVTVKINGDTVSNIATKAYVDNSGGLGFTPAAFIAANISISGYTTTTAWYIGRYNANVNMWNGLLVPLEKYAGYSLFQATTNGVLWGLDTSDGDWHIITNGSYSVRT